MSRISYRCLPEERSSPIAEKTFWHIYRDNTRIGCIRSDEDATMVNPNVRIWSPVLFESEFDPFEFPHADGPEGMTEPFVTTNDDADHEHQLELHSNSLMTLHEARLWVRTLTRSGDQ